MRNYKIPVTWEMYGVYNIIAESLEEAEKMAMDEIRPLPEEQHYIDDSIQLDNEEVINKMNKELIL